MFDKIRSNWKLTNEVMNKILKQLGDVSAWIYDNDIIFKHLDSDLVIKWGYVSSYSGGREERYVSSPTHVQIPLRYRKQFNKYIQQIRTRSQVTNNMEFLNQYLDGKYTASVLIKHKLKEKSALWLTEQKIYDWYMSYNTIWFKNKEDVMAFKLWIE